MTGQMSSPWTLAGKNRQYHNLTSSRSKPISVHPERVEGLSFLFNIEKKGQCFDKLSTNGFES
jgi:hypothetical protein